ncbi:MAG: hypothetical protein C4343_04190, partial [Chloroflexota bacterium]
MLARNMAWTYAAALTLVLVATSACGASERTPATTTAACPVTEPNGSTPPGERPHALHHGNGKLWTDLWPEGKFIV